MNINDWFFDIEYGYLVLSKKEQNLLTFNKMFEEKTFGHGWKKVGWVLASDPVTVQARIDKGILKPTYNPAVVRALNAVAADPNHPGFDVPPDPRPWPNSNPGNGNLFP